MPIEFRCSQCDKLLRTGDDTAGKHAKCPECGTVMTIPTPDQGAASPSQPMGGFEAAASPFGSAQAPAAPDSMNPYQSPTGLGPEPQSFAPSGEIRPTQIEFSETLSRTWSVFGDRWLPVLGAIVLIFIINMAGSFAMQGVIAGVGAAVQDPKVAGAFAVLVQICFQVFGLWLGIGLQMFTLGVVRGEEPRYGLLFAGGRFLLSIILCTILTFIIVAFGCLLLIIPGIIFALMLLQAQLLIIDRNMGVMDALSTSREVMVGNKATVFLIGLVAGILGLLVILVTCGLGYFAVGPYMVILSVVIYFSVTGQPTIADQHLTAPQPVGGTPFGQPAPETPPGDSPFNV